MGPMSPHSLGSLGVSRDSMKKGNQGMTKAVEFPATANGAGLKSTDYSHGAFAAPAKIRSMVVGTINPDARDSGFPITPHTGKN